MLRCSWCLPLILLRAGSSKQLSSAVSLISKPIATMLVPPRLLAQAWQPKLCAEQDLHPPPRRNEQQPPNSQKRHRPASAVIQAIERALPLLEDVTSVPFVCRYRSDVIDPLTTKQVYQLQALWSKHQSLESLRNKVLAAVTRESVPDTAASSSAFLIERIQTSTSKSELEDLYAPYKPPSKGSKLEILQKDQPHLVEAVNVFWNHCLHHHPSAEETKSKANVFFLSSMQSRDNDDVLYLLSTKIADEPLIWDVVLQELHKHCRIQTKLFTTSNAGSAPSTKKSVSKVAAKTPTTTTYQTYQNFSCHLRYLKDFQVLAIRRGVQDKALTLSFDVDSDKMIQSIHHQLYRNVFQGSNSKKLSRDQHSILLTDACREAWTRLLRRRGTSRLWAQSCQRALERAQEVFADNVYRALLAPPLQPIPTKVLALDPGFQAGIKCALVDGRTGAVEKFETLPFLSNQRSKGIQKLSHLLDQVAASNERAEPVTIALGNGHGSQAARALLLEAKAESTNLPIELNIRLVSEAGASVWSVSEAAQLEFPEHQPASLAAVSIARRLLNPLHELVKVPPRSLGLGMYQHDLSAKELDQQLHVVGVDAVATVGVDVNTCSLEILQKVPGITNALAVKILQARPLLRRNELLRIAGLGPKTFENCAAFCRVMQGEEPLDATLIHPESYDLARWLLRELSWELEPASALHPSIPDRELWPDQWKDLLQRGSQQFDVSTDRVLAVLGNLVDSIQNVDPRLDRSSNSSQEMESNSIGSPDHCVDLSPELSESDAALSQQVPVRKIIGTVRNIVDFGAFVDFGGHSDGLLHVSNLGPIALDSLLIGQQVGVDVISVKDGRISLALTGLEVTSSSGARRGTLLSKTTAHPSYSTQQTRSFSRKRKTDSKTERPRSTKRSKS